MRAICHLPRHPSVALGLVCSAHFLPHLCAQLAFPGGDSEGKEDPQDAQPAQIWGRLWWELKSQAQQLIAERGGSLGQ